jgi:hypothetical protein
LEDKGQTYRCWWREDERRAPWRCGEDEGLRREYGGVSNENEVHALWHWWIEDDAHAA